MSTFRRFVQRLSTFFRPSRAESELAREIDSHLQLLEDQFIAQGLTRDEARLAARRSFGGVEQAKEHQRDARGFRWLDDSRIDFKLGARMLRKYPALSLIGGTGLAVAIAIGAGFFSFFNAYIYSTLPLEDGNRVVALENWDLDRNNEERRAMHDLVAWRASMTAVSEISAFRTIGRNLIVPGGASEPIRIAQITASAFRLARIAPERGRYLVDDDERPGANPVVVIGHDVWQSRFGGDPSIVGRDVRIGNITHTIVGVMPANFLFPVDHNYWTPLSTDTSKFARKEGPAIFIFGRLRDGVTMEQAQAELATLGKRAAAESPTTHAKLEPRVMPFAYPILDIQGLETWQYTVMQGLISLLVVIVALNVAILVYARTATRQGEIAVRTALGATRRRIVGQLFIEALVLSAIAAVAGLVLAKIGVSQGHAIMKSEGAGMPYWIDLGIPVSAMAYAAGLAIVAAIVAGALPALQATGRRAQLTLKQTTGSGGLQLGRTWTLLIIAQVAIAVAALPIVFSTVWGDIEGALTRPAFDERQFVGAAVLPDPDAPLSATALAKLRTDLVAALEAEPAVEDVTIAEAFPGDEPAARIEIDGVATPQSGAPIVRYNAVPPDFFETFDAKTVIGRGLTAADAAGPNVVVVNQAFAQRLLADGNVIGARVRYLGSAFSSPEPADVTSTFEIVGVVTDLHRNSVRPDLIRPAIYHPFKSAASTGVITTVRVRGVDAKQFGPRLRAIATSLDPTARVQVVPFGDMERQRQLALRLLVLVLSLITIAVLLLSSAGVYAMMSFTVSQRKKEIGIRAAMGADAGQLLRSVFAKAAMQLGAGIAVGAGASVLLNIATDGAMLGTFGLAMLPIMSAAMMAVGLIASIGPARRGLRIQPTEALRAE